MAGKIALALEMGCYGVLYILEKVGKEEREIETRRGVRNKAYRELEMPLSTACIIPGLTPALPQA